MLFEDSTISECCRFMEVEEGGEGGVAGKKVPVTKLDLDRKCAVFFFLEPWTRRAPPCADQQSGAIALP